MHWGLHSMEKFRCFLVHKWLQAEGCVVDILHDIALSHEELQFPGLRLAGFEDLLQQSYHTLDVHLHQVVFLVVLRGFLAQLVDGGGDNRQRR